MTAPAPSQRFVITPDDGSGIYGITIQDTQRQNMTILLNIKDMPTAENIVNVITAGVN